MANDIHPLDHGKQVDYQTACDCELRLASFPRTCDILFVTVTLDIHTIRKVGIQSAKLFLIYQVSVGSRCTR